MAQTYSFPTGDFVASTLNGAITSGATSATIGTGLTIPASNGILFVDYDSTTAVGSDNGPETISYTSYNSGTGAITGVTRGLGWTTGVAHGNGAKVASALSALHFTANNQITAPMLDTSAITLGYAERTSNFTNTTSGSSVDITSLTLTLTVPAGGRRMKVTAYTSQCFSASSSVGNYVTLEIKEDGTTIGEATSKMNVSNADERGMTAMASKIPSAGSHTYKVTVKQTGTGTMTVGGSATSPAFILVELV